MGFTNACQVFVLISALFSQTLVYCASISLTAHASAQSKPKGYGSAKRAVIVGRSEYRFRNTVLKPSLKLHLHVSTFYLVGIDGFGGSHFRNSTGHFPALRSFMEQGSHTTRARGVFPTVSRSSLHVL
jgi:predicted AlkP superfamily pyrophosphatase or phosphodiesterase